MKYEFSDVFNPPPLIQQKKKYSTFTVKEIGGPAELVKWRAEQARKWDEYQANRAAFKEKQKMYICGPDAPEGDGVTWSGQGTTLGAKDADWQSKLQAALAARKELYKPEIVTDKKAWTYERIPEPRLSLWQKTKRWIRGIWDSANFS